MEDRRDLGESSVAGNAPSGDRSFLHRVALFDGVAVLFLLAFAAVWYAADALLLVFACILFAVLLYDLSVRLQKRLHLRRGVALSLLVGIMLLIFVGGGSLMAPQIAQQTGELAQVIPQALRRLREALERMGMIGDLVARLPPTEEIAAQLATMLPRAGLFFSGVLGAIGNVAIIVFVGVYFAVQPYIYIDGLVTLVPHRKRQRVREVLDEIGRTLAQWLMGKMCSMLVVGVATSIGLMLLDMPLALILGILAGAFDFIPYIGPIIASVPAILIAFAESPTLALYVALLFIAIQAAEGYLLLPLVEKRTVALPPALTIIMQVLLGTLFGLAGVALATPLTAVLAVLVTMLYVQDVLGDPVRTPSEQARAKD